MNKQTSAALDEQIPGATGIDRYQARQKSVHGSSQPTQGIR